MSFLRLEKAVELTSFVIINVFIASFSPAQGERNHMVDAKFTRPVNVMPMSISDCYWHPPHWRKCTNSINEACHDIVRGINLDPKQRLLAYFIWRLIGYTVLDIAQTLCLVKRSRFR